MSWMSQSTNWEAASRLDQKQTDEREVPVSRDWLPAAHECLLSSVGLLDSLVLNPDFCRGDA